MAQVIKNTLTPTQTKRVNLMIRALFSLGDIVSAPFFEPDWQKQLTQDIGAQAKAVCDELLAHKFEFAKVDAALTDVAELLDGTFKRFSSYYSAVQNQPGFNVATASTDDLNAMRQLLPRKFAEPRKTLAEGLAKLCREQDIFWDDSRRSTYEMDEFTQHTVFGKALYDYYCFASQQDDADAVLQSKSKPRSKKAAGTPPANNFKATGPQSGNARGLVGQPGQKFRLYSPIYCIEAINANTKASAVTAFIRPLDPIGSGANNANKVFVGTANGYGYCTCYFQDPQEADAFMGKINASPSTVRSFQLQVRKKSAKSNGYFRISTEFGDVYVSAAKLNENVVEAKGPAKERQLSDEYVEAFFKYE